MKEKLMKLLKNSIDDCTDNKLEHIADYLIENGVILPLCKVGDTVYVKNRPMVISYLHIEDEIYYVIQFDCDDYNDCGDCPLYEEEDDSITMGYFEFTEKDIGKTVFLTKEEAQKVLEGRSKEK